VKKIYSAPSCLTIERERERQKDRGLGFRIKDKSPYPILTSDWYPPSQFLLQPNFLFILVDTWIGRAWRYHGNGLIYNGTSFCFLGYILRRRGGGRDSSVGLVNARAIVVGT